MAAASRKARYTAVEALRAILQDDDESEMEDPESSDSEVDHISEPSDHSDTDIVEAPDLLQPQPIMAAGEEPPVPARGRCLTRGRARGRPRNRAWGRGDGPPNAPELIDADQPVARAEQQAPDVREDTFVARNGTIWQKHPPDVGRRQQQDIIRQRPGITNAVNCDSPMDAFAFFITPAMIDIIVLETNREARRQVAIWNTDHPDNKKAWKVVDEMEMIAFIGLCILAGVHKSNHESVASLWSEKEGRPVFSATMSRSRFTDILRYLRYDNRATRPARQATDKMAAFREFWTLFQTQLPKFYVPGTDLCVDEQLVPFRGRCGFRQYIPSKPAKYGIKIWWCCDADTSYPLKGEVYLGRQPGEQREVGQGARVVKDLVSPWYRSGRNVTADNFFTTIPLVQDLLHSGLTYVGTLRSNKPDIPDAMRPVNTNREQYSSIFAFKDQLTLVSYVPKQNKCVLALSSMHHNDNVEGDDRKPEIILHYNATKSGVDNLDHLSTMYTARRKVNRWPVVLFGNCVDVAAIAAFIIWVVRFPEWKSSEGRRRRRIFLRELGDALVMPQIQRRAATAATLQKPIRMAMQMVGVQADVHPRPEDTPRDSKRKRCAICPRTCDKKVRVTCDTCRRPVCPEHSVQHTICEDCL